MRKLKIILTILFCVNDKVYAQIGDAKQFKKNHTQEILLIGNSIFQ